MRTGALQRTASEAAAPARLRPVEVPVPEPEPTPAELVARAEAMQPMLRERQAEAERRGYMDEAPHRPHFGLGTPAPTQRVL